MKQSDIPSYLKDMDFRPDFVFCHYISCFIDPDTIRTIHQMGMKAMVWTVDNPEYARRLSDMGADGIITNEPGLMINTLMD